MLCKKEKIYVYAGETGGHWDTGYTWDITCILSSQLTNG